MNESVFSRSYVRAVVCSSKIPQADRLNVIARKLGLLKNGEKETHEHEPPELMTNMRENLKPTSFLRSMLENDSLEARDI